ncbi:Uncharacterised protein [Collinsella aerofaciens]|nr:Uncharacterised protein [Collinsella aerofaciens]
MQPSTICLRICSQLFAFDIVLTGQAIDITQRIAKGARSRDINNRSTRIRQCKQTKPPHFARAPALVFNELIRITPCRPWQQHLHFIQKRIRRADAVEQRCCRSAKHSIRFNDRNSGCQLKDTIFNPKIIPIDRIRIHMVVKTKHELFLHKLARTAFIPRINCYKQLSILMNSKGRE